jgi:hypothetical protein
MGAPSYDHPFNRKSEVDLIWHGWDWYEIFAQDIREFNKMADVPSDTDDWVDIMKNLPEEMIKKSLCEILSLKCEMGSGRGN